jgi:23S rRNA (uracil1939-C5)-methyltransferase
VTVPIHDQVGSSTAPTPELPDDPAATLCVESLDIDAQGIAHRTNGKVVFIEGALPFEEVRVRLTRRKSSFEKAVVTEVLRPSSQRVEPACPHFGLHDGACGGCKMQHMHPAGQVAVKQRVLEDNLWHLGKVRPQNILRPIQGPDWGYRYRARLSVRHVRKKGEVLVGFHERKSSFVADMRECRVLPEPMSALLVPLRELVFGMDARETCPQIELAAGDAAGGILLALVLRHLEPLSSADLQRLRDFARLHSRPYKGRHCEVQWWLQSQGPDTVQLLDADARPLAYMLPEFGIRMPFKPTDFTQVNPQVNQLLVGYALRLLGAAPQERVIDWFCGLGNFTLPLATRVSEVVGVEGSKVLVARARDNAENARRAEGTPRLGGTTFLVRNIFDMDAQQLAADGTAHRWLLDPPREGAFALVKALSDLRQQGRDGVPPSGWQPPSRLVYVSCNPATLARDAGLLVHQGGYQCSAAGVVNMFPHTAHVESIAVFDRID